MKAVGLIFSGMYNDGLDNLTRGRTVASVPFGGRYRLIDFILSNMVNSDIMDIGVITKYNYHSLTDHLGNCQDWDLSRKRGGLVIIPPFSTGTSGGYRGKIEELRAALTFLNGKDADYVILADTDTICNIDFKAVIKSHIESGNDMTIVTAKVPEDEKGTSELVFDSVNGRDTDGIYLNYAAKKGQYSSIGMYIISRSLLIELVTSLAAKGFYHLERDLIQQGFNKGTLSIGIFRFDGLVLRNRTIREYHTNNLMLKEEWVRNEIFRPEAPIYTTVRDEVSTYYGEYSSASDCLIADGCRILGRVDNSVLFRNVVIEKNAVVRNSVIMAGCTIREGAVVENAIIDKEVTVTELRRIIGAPQSPTIIQKGETV